MARRKTASAEKTYFSHAKVGFVPMGKMSVHSHAQRLLNQNHVEYLQANFDPDLLGLIVVSQRGDDYRIIDGQHRMNAAREWFGSGWETQQLQCQIYTDLSDSEEADMFLRRNDTKPVAAYDKFEKAVVAGHDREQAIAKVCKDLGIAISRTKRTEGALSCVSALTRIYDKYGEAVLKRSLRMAAQLFGTSHGLDGFVIESLAMLYARYDKHLSDEVVRTKIGDFRGGLGALMARTNIAQQKFGRNKSACMASVMVDIINAGYANRDKKRLANWWQWQPEAKAA